MKKLLLLLPVAQLLTGCWVERHVPTPEERERDKLEKAVEFRTRKDICINQEGVFSITRGQNGEIISTTCAYSKKDGV